MMNRSQQSDPHTADVISNEHHHPYARRSITTFFTIIGIIILFLSGVFFFRPSSDNEPKNVTYNEGDTTYQADLKLPGDEVDNAIAGAVDKFFDVEPQNVIPGEAVNSVIDVTNYINVRTQTERVVYQNSFYNVMDSAVDDVNGEKIGELSDIVINKDTGDATAIIMDREDSLYQSDLDAISFEEIRYKDDNGDFVTTVTEKDITNRQDFDYTMLGDQHVSLKNLESGQVFDDKGKYVGEIDALIYRDAEVNNIYFSLKPSLTPRNREMTIKYPFDDLNIIESPDGYDVHLSTEETRQLAELLLAE